MIVSYDKNPILTMDQKLKSLIDSIHRAFDEAKDDRDKIRKEISELSSGIRQEISDLSSSIEEEISELGDSIRGEISDLSDSISEDISEINSSISEIIASCTIDPTVITLYESLGWIDPNGE